MASSYPANRAFAPRRSPGRVGAPDNRGAPRPSNENHPNIPHGRDGYYDGPGSGNPYGSDPWDGIEIPQRMPPPSRWRSPIRYRPGSYTGVGTIISAGMLIEAAQTYGDLLGGRVEQANNGWGKNRICTWGNPPGPASGARNYDIGSTTFTNLCAAPQFSIGGGMAASATWLYRMVDYAINFGTGTSHSLCGSIFNRPAGGNLRRPFTLVRPVYDIKPWADPVFRPLDGGVRFGNNGRSPMHRDGYDEPGKPPRARKTKPRAKPEPGTKERKLKAGGARGPLGAAVNVLSEGADAIDALYKALPKEARRDKSGIVSSSGKYPGRPYATEGDKLAAIAKNWKSIDPLKAGKNLAVNHAIDHVAGHVFGGAQKGLANTGSTYLGDPIHGGGAAGHSIANAGTR